MIEEKLVIDFEEYFSTFHEKGELRDVAEIDKAVTKFLSGTTTVAHHGFNLHGTDFCAEVGVSFSDNDGGDSVSLDIKDGFGVWAEYCFDATMKLVMTKTNNCVVIDSE